MRDREPFVVLLGEVEVHLAPPEQIDAADAIRDALESVRQRCVGEDDAAEAIAVFEDATSAPLNYVGAHLFLAEVYLSGSTPQHGVDTHRAVGSLVSFLEAGFDRGGVAATAAQPLDAAIAQILGRLEASALVPKAEALLRLAKRSPSLRAAALLAHLGGTKAQSESDGVAALEIVRTLVGDFTACEAERVELRHCLRVEDERRAMLESALDLAEGRGSQIEAASHQLVAQLERSEAMIVGMDDELRRSQQEQCHLREVAAATEEMAMQCRHMYDELERQRALCHELEARNATLGEIVQVQREQQQQQSRQIQLQELQQQHLQHLQDRLLQQNLTPRKRSSSVVPGDFKAPQVGEAPSPRPLPRLRTRERLETPPCGHHNRQAHEARHDEASDVLGMTYAPGGREEEVERLARFRYAGSHAISSTRRATID